MYGRYKHSAKKRNISFELTFEEFINLTQQNCYYCKHFPNQIVKQRGAFGEYVYNGIDRLDNTKGYTLDNCVSCCKTCNIMKLDLSFDIFSCRLCKMLLASFLTFFTVI